MKETAADGRRHISMEEKQAETFTDTQRLLKVSQVEVAVTLISANIMK